MVHQVFEVDEIKLSQFFTIETCNQLGGAGAAIEFSRFQRGYGLRLRYQRGTGVGNVLRSLWRFLVPLAREAGQALTKEGASAGARILQNIAQGADIKEAVVTEGKQAMRNVAGLAAEKLQQQGSGIVYRKRPAKRKPTSLDIIKFTGRSVSNSSLQKKKKNTNLGFF